MAEEFIKSLYISGTGKITNMTAKEQKCGMITQPMWVPGKTATYMVQAYTLKQMEQSLKETGSKKNSMVFLF